MSEDANYGLSVVLKNFKMADLEKSRQKHATWVVGQTYNYSLYLRPENAQITNLFYVIFFLVSKIDP